ncbi:ATP-binding protein [Pedobacter antarcticus]|uniref:sensor histidine kinase n=1 Tax=Pedobacter antarcticus TaxID=34086 RepID=UPI001C594C12|nr:HAMP domain-containing sensor histidine kinase [Pedobacter antarcticus]
MKIALRLTLVFTLLTASILFAFAMSIYLTSKQDREDEFYDRLRIKTVTRAELFIDAKVHSTLIQAIHQNNKKIMNEAQVTIYDLNGNLLYQDEARSDILKNNPGLFSRIRKEKEIHGHKGKWQTLALLYNFSGKQYIITGAAYDYHGYNKINNMFDSMVLFYTISILLILITGFFFARNALNPVKNIIMKARNISASNLNSRLTLKKSKDELYELATTFNAMLNRISTSFESQKNFVSNISHELRTPLATIAAEIELTLQHPKNPEEYQTALQLILTDTRQLIRLSSALLDFAKASYDPAEISFTKIRVDEIILDARLQTLKLNPHYKVAIQFENDFESDEAISLIANPYLLQVAFTNLFENGCKYSADEQCRVTICFDQQNIILKFIDHGIGIQPGDYEKVFIPFFRANNILEKNGTGIGLSLTKKIILLHKGTITIESSPDVATTFTVTLPNIMSA